MKWDARRPIPWRRLLGEWALVTIALIGATAAFTDTPVAETFGAVVLGGAVYLGLGAVLARLGYQRATLRQLRSAARTTTTRAPDRPSPRRPAPTKRTGGSQRRRR